jgi:hypothetical protein
MDPRLQWFVDWVMCDIYFRGVIGGNKNFGDTCTIKASLSSEKGHFIVRNPLRRTRARDFVSSLCTMANPQEKV